MPSSRTDLREPDDGHGHLAHGLIPAVTQIAAGHAPDVIRVLNYQPTQLVAQGNALLNLDEMIKNDKTLNVSDFVPASVVKRLAAKYRA